MLLTSSLGVTGSQFSTTWGVPFKLGHNNILFGTLKIHVKTETQSLGLLSKGQ